MGTTVVQVRDVPEEVVTRLKQRAVARGQSLAAFIRDLLVEEATLPAVEEVMDRIATRAPINYSSEIVRELREDGRR
jgi:plasmid stability protein